ncbi:hypothetical protein ACFLIN_03790 [Corynebacterium kutscheri]|uniref:hypothetical protein n=1 Tax=Corynebacterium kutscheri TaxID=35755 RepID=UPI0037BFB758
MDIDEVVERIKASSSVPVTLPDIQDFDLEFFLDDLAGYGAHVSDIEAKRELIAWWSEDEDWLDHPDEYPMWEQTLEALHIFANLEPKVEIHLPPLP